MEEFLDRGKVDILRNSFRLKFGRKDINLWGRNRNREKKIYRRCKGRNSLLVNRRSNKE